MQIFFVAVILGSLQTSWLVFVFVVAVVCYNNVEQNVIKNVMEFHLSTNFVIFLFSFYFSYFYFYYLLYFSIFLLKIQYIFLFTKQGKKETFLIYTHTCTGSDIHIH